MNFILGTERWQEHGSAGSARRTILRLNVGTAKACQGKQESETARMREMMAAIKEQERILLNSGRRVTQSETTRHRLATLFSHDEDAQEIIGTNLVV